MSSKQRYDDWDGSAENRSKPWKVKEAQKRQRVPHEFGDGSRYQPVPPEKKPRRALKPRQSEPAAKSRPFVPPPWLDGEDQPVARAPSAAPRAPLGQPVAQPADLEPGQILFDDKQKRYFSITRGCSYTRFYDGRVTVLPLGFDYRVTVSSRAAVRTIDVTTAFAWRDAWRAGGGLVDGFAPTAQDRAAKTAPHVAAETRIILIKNLLEEARRFSDPDAHSFRCNKNALGYYRIRFRVTEGAAEC